MKKQFVTYEIALKLKELGFDEPCFAFYGLSRDDYKTIRLSIFQNLKTDYLPDVHHLNVTCDAPLYQQAFRFFREKYKLHLTITSISQESWQWHITKPGESLGKLYEEDFYTYEDAEIGGLKKLIKIAKEQNVK